MVLREKTQNVKAETTTLISRKDIDRYYTLPLLIPKEDLVLSEYLQVSSTEVDFGFQLADTLSEKEVSIKNISRVNLVVRVQVGCEDQQTHSPEEYVYSLRKQSARNYSERQSIILSPQSAVTYLVVLKVPQLQRECRIGGSVSIHLDHLPSKCH